MLGDGRDYYLSISSDVFRLVKVFSVLTPNMGSTYDQSTAAYPIIIGYRIALWTPDIRLRDTT